MKKFNHIITKQVNEAAKNVTKWEDMDEIVMPDGTVIDMQALLEEQQRAKAALVHLAPEWGGVISKLRFIYTFRVDTQATDGYNLFINPKFTQELDFTGKVFVMAHEVMHCLLQHMRRGQAAGHDPHKSNIAADYEVNCTLVELGFVSESTIRKIEALYDPKYATLGYETIYSMNPPGPAKQSKKGQQPQRGEGSDAPSGGGQSQPHSADYKAGWAKAIEDYKAGKLKL